MKFDVPWSLLSEGMVHFFTLNFLQSVCKHSNTLRVKSFKVNSGMVSIIQVDDPEKTQWWTRRNKLPNDLHRNWKIQVESFVELF